MSPISALLAEVGEIAEDLAEEAHIRGKTVQPEFDPHNPNTCNKSGENKFCYLNLYF